MKITFRGWKREIMAHNHQIIPVEYRGNTYFPKAKDGTVEWNSSLTALGKIERAGLNGSFLVEFKFEAEELKNWLLKYVAEQPEEGLRLVALAQAEATIELAKKKVGLLT